MTEARIMIELTTDCIETLLGALACNASLSITDDVHRVALAQDGSIWCQSQCDPEKEFDWREFTGRAWELAPVWPDPPAFVAEVKFSPAHWVLTLP